MFRNFRNMFFLYWQLSEWDARKCIPLPGLSHYDFNLNFFFGAVKRDHISFYRSTVYGHGSNTFFCAIRILDRDVIGYATEITFCREAV